MIATRAYFNHVMAGLCPPIKDDFEIANIELDSRRIENDGVFIALKGHHSDGRNYIPQALKRGARICLSEPLNQQQKISFANFEANIIELEDLRSKSSYIAGQWLGFPGRKIFLVGFTGTNGKTSASYFFAQLCTLLKRKSAVIGTTGVGELSTLQKSSLTTPDPIRLQCLLDDFHQQRVEYCALEASSHALSQYRVEDVGIKVAVFINLSSEHLDYHGDLENYYAAKRRLFFLPSVEQGVINIDDPYGLRLYREVSEQRDIPLYALTLNDENSGTIEPTYLLKVKVIAKGFEGSHLQVTLGQENIRVHSPLVGQFNIYNLMVSVLALYCQGRHLLDTIFSKVSELSAPHGRLERFSSPNGIQVFVDYAHTSDGLDKVLKTLKEHKSGAMITVFGCGGDRDPSKRAKMAEIAENLSDFCIVTDDNPRFESPADIVIDICKGFRSLKAVNIIHDRHQAITKALQMAKPGDTVLIAGKGHEDYQIVGANRLPFSDREVIINWLEETE